MSKDAFDLSSKLIKGVTEKEHKARANDLKLYRTKGIKTRISPLYEKYTGGTVLVAHNGNFRKYPVDGTEFTLSQGHYRRLRKYLQHIDRDIKTAATNAKFIDTTMRGDFKKIPTN